MGTVLCFRGGPAKWRTVPIFALLILALAAGCGGGATASPVVGKPAPPIEGDDLAGRPWRLQDARGQVVLVTFWATWCIPCLEEIPDLRHVARTFAAQGVQVVGANVDVDDRQRLAAFARQQDIAYPVVMATPRTVEAYRVAVIPTTFLIGPDGIIRKRYLGPRAYETFARDINALIGVP